MCAVKYSWPLPLECWCPPGVVDACNTKRIPASDEADMRVCGLRHRGVVDYLVNFEAETSICKPQPRNC